MSSIQTLVRKKESPLITRADLHPQATKDIAAAMNAILADVFIETWIDETERRTWFLSSKHVAP